ncbi:hypothetical protein RF11_00092 [Thelohanellus kitauei]|uniref:Uncharacterized protein n=1 Tax=Thelohanellus kitauei TaxID=669202 RepID=A0A0C2J6Q5_THEKT|nr:hypothetical protein RF11_00092 [Thelohanellus kitauei]
MDNYMEMWPIRKTVLSCKHATHAFLLAQSSHLEPFTFRRLLKVAFHLYEKLSKSTSNVFASGRFIYTLKNSEFCHCDGTLEVVPSIFTQLFTIHVTIGNTVIPVRPSYEEVFGIIRGVSDRGNQSVSILMDIEMSMINAERNIFPYSSIKGYFSFTLMNLEKNTAISSNFTQI